MKVELKRLMIELYVQQTVTLLYRRLCEGLNN